MNEQRQRIIDMLVKHGVLGASEAVDELIAASHPSWLPIHTAPRDYSDFLMYGDGEMAIGYWGGGSENDWKPLSHDINPTHWMPLPDPPSGVPSGGNGDR